MIHRRRFGTALAAGLLGARVARAQQPPNVLVLLMSEMRADAMRSMGAAIAQTPALDALAKQGCLVRKTISAVPESGGRGAMAALTGRYPAAGSTDASAADSYAGVPALPQILAGQGYQTAVIGRPPTLLADAGADTVRLFPDPDYQTYLSESFPLFEDDYARLTAPPGIPPEGLPPWKVGEGALPATAAPTRWIGDQTLAFLQSRKDAGPWCCVTAFSKPREPYILPNPWAKRYDLNLIPLPELPAIRPLPPTTTDEARDYAVASQTEVIRRLLQKYFGAVSFVDDEVRRIVRELRILEQLDNTIIAVVGDSGHMLGDHGRMFGGVPYDGALHVPGIVRFPTAVRANGRIEAPVSSTSFVPTLLELAGAKIDAPFDSPSLASQLHGESMDGEGEAFATMGFNTIRTEGWKLTEPGDHPTWEPQLFNLRADPGERNNLYGAAEAVEAQAQLTARLADWRDRRS